MQIDHVTIVTPDLAEAAWFFTEIAGLTDGPRPPFGVPGHWLYSDGRPLIHLVLSTQPARAERAAPRIDHVSFRVEPGDAWHALLDRLHRAGVRYQLAEVPLTRELQLFVGLGPGVVVEFVTRADGGAR